MSRDVIPVKHGEQDIDWQASAEQRACAVSMLCFHGWNGRMGEEDEGKEREMVKLRRLELRTTNDWSRSEDEEMIESKSADRCRNETQKTHKVNVNRFKPSV